jgi:DNA-directed RNA polymerase subunit beta'
MSLILGVPMGELEKVVYFAGHIITSTDEEKRKEILTKIDSEYKTKVASLEDEESIEKLKGIFKKVKSEISGIVKGAVVDELTHSKFSQKYEGLYIAEIGSEAIYNLMRKVDLKKLEKKLEKELEEVSAVNKPKLVKRITLVRSMNLSEVRPE